MKAGVIGIKGTAAQLLHPERGLDVTQIEFNVPAAAVQHLEDRLGVCY